MAPISALLEPWVTLNHNLIYAYTKTLKDPNPNLLLTLTLRALLLTLTQTLRALLLTQTLTFKNNSILKLGS